MEKSPLAPESYPELPEIEGVKMASCEAGIKYKNKKDLMLAVLDENTNVAGVLTRSKTASSAIDWCRKHLPQGKARALVVNSGNANAFTGMKGLQAVEATVKAAADMIDCPHEQIFVASTGVIGEPLEPGKFVGKLTELNDRLQSNNWLDAAEAIMTTDTYPKLATIQTRIGDTEVTINGIAKGSGMIAPDMATMLSFIFTDAPISSEVLQQLLTENTEHSFNAITVDGDTSTSDTVLLFATGAAEKRGAPLITNVDDSKLAEFRNALKQVMQNLAHQIVRDGEGATKFVRIDIEGAEDTAAAKTIGLAIANSPLVKTAIAGEDANWGRIVMAVGKSGEAADRDKLDIWFGDIKVASKGERDTSYSEEKASEYMKNEEIVIRIDVGIGDGSFSVWTCDLTHGYISINADYRS